MRSLIWLLRAVVLVALFGLAVKNGGPVDLRMYFNTAWQAPLSLVILASFAAGALIGAAAGLLTLIRQRREIGRLRRQLRDLADSGTGKGSASGAESGPDSVARKGG